MQRRTCRRILYFRLTVTLISSISASLILLFITHGRRNLDQTSNIADRTVIFVRTSHNCQSRLSYPST